jgi:antitoxin (DNA-binding transcriptional repressor) of toxin-antitoxin stability system
MQTGIVTFPHAGLQITVTTLALAKAGDGESGLVAAAEDDAPPPRTNVITTPVIARTVRARAMTPPFDCVRGQAMSVDDESVRGWFRTPSEFKRIFVRASHACYGGGVARKITQRQLRNESGEIMRALDRGETFVVTRNGVPVGELTPLRQRQFVSAEAAVAVFSGAPAIDLERFREEVDGWLDQEPAPRG